MDDLGERLRRLLVAFAEPITPGDDALDRIRARAAEPRPRRNRSGAPGQGCAAHNDDDLGSHVMTIVSPDPTGPADSPETVSLTGTAFLRIPMPGRPECSGLLADGDQATARVEDGALQIDVDDIDTALAWRNAFQQAASHLIHHRDRRAERQAHATSTASDTTDQNPAGGMR